MAEYKWVMWPDIKHLASAALAGFVDYGGAWYDGSPHRTGTDLGAGLRVGSIRLPSIAGAFRLDLARRFKNDVEPAGWVFVFGSGFAFERVIK
jgi:outer membrane protein assembly factor BamA